LSDPGHRWLVPSSSGGTARPIGPTAAITSWRWPAAVPSRFVAATNQVIWQSAAPDADSVTLSRTFRITPCHAQCGGCPPSRAAGAWKGRLVGWRTTRLNTTDGTPSISPLSAGELAKHRPSQRASAPRSWTRPNALLGISPAEPDAVRGERHAARLSTAGAGGAGSWRGLRPFRAGRARLRVRRQAHRHLARHGRKWMCHRHRRLLWR
jgi:hypothetical protein